MFCLKDRPGSLEHVFPLAVGGCLTTLRVCEPCNSFLGREVDSGLTNNVLVVLRRSQLGLAGNSGTVPNPFKTIFRHGTLADRPDHRVVVEFNTQKKMFDVRLLHHESMVTLPDGREVKQILVDASKAASLPKILQRERKRAGQPPATPEELEKELANVEQRTIEHPPVKHSIAINEAALRRGVLKIVYELAFLWLGEDYLDDPVAAQFRSAILSGDESSLGDIRREITGAQDCDAFRFWSPNKDMHFAYSTCSEEGIMLCVRIFDVAAARIIVAADPHKYLTAGFADRRLRFLAIDPVTRRSRESAFIQEMGRIAQAMLASRLTGDQPAAVS
jgi:hypothetical protein